MQLSKMFLSQIRLTLAIYNSTKGLHPFWNLCAMIRWSSYEKLIKKCKHIVCISQAVKIDLNKASFPQQKTIQRFKVNVLGFRMTMYENPNT